MLSFVERRVVLAPAQIRCGEAHHIIMTNFVLIPGAWMGAWVWEEVAEGLRALGHHVSPVTLSGLSKGTEHQGRWPAPDLAALEGNDLSAEQMQWLLSRFVGHPGRTICEPTVLSRPLSAQRATYIACTMGGHWLSEDVKAMWQGAQLDLPHHPDRALPDGLDSQSARRATR